MIYTFLYSLLLIFSLPFVYIYFKRKGYNFGLKERFTLYKDYMDSSIWFHCASVGELKAAYPIIKYFSQKENVIITIFSPRAKDFALSVFQNEKVRFLPFDLPIFINRFIKMYNPKILIIIEKEVWINLVKISSKKFPVVSINSKISKKLSVLNSFSLFLTNSEENAEKIKRYIKDKEKVVVCGDLKFLGENRKDIKFDKNGKKIIIGASTHNPEEKILIDTFLELKKDIENIALIIAPRHLERLNEIENLLKERNIDYSLRTKTDKMEKDVMILDTMGELSGFYQYADVVFVGGTFANIGGHNILEPILENKPVIIGNYYYKVEDLYNQLKDYGIISSVKNKEELKEKIIEYLNNNQFSKLLSFKDLQQKIFKCYINNIENLIKGD